MRAVDTNVLVRLITRDDPRRAGVADNFVARGAWVSLIALAEAISVLDSVYGLSPSSIAKAVDMLLDHKDLTIQEPDVVAAALELFRAKPTLGFPDCLIVETGRKAGHLPLGTFDRGLAKVPGVERL